jgi:antitoxin ParD1/3/4
MDHICIIFVSGIYEYNLSSMASTSLSLGPHWEQFIQSKIASGRYGTVTEVVREALRHLEERDKRLEALRAHLTQGAEQAKKGQFDEDYSLGGLLDELDD